MSEGRPSVYAKAGKPPQAHTTEQSQTGLVLLAACSLSGHQTRKS